MDLEFEVTSQSLKRTDINKVYNKDYNNYACVFDFGEDTDLITGDSYVIFKDAWNNKITIHLEKDMNIVSCPLPNKMLKGSLFKVYVRGDEWKTNSINIQVDYSTFPKTHTIIEDGGDTGTEYDYEYDDHTDNIIVDDCNRPHHECTDTVECNKNEVDVFTEIFSKLDTFIDRIIYTDKQILLYNKDTLIKTINLPFLTDEDVQKSFIDNLSSVAISGDYNDLNNIPVEFNPSHHNHLINDVSDYEDNFNYDLNLILDLLSDEISKN